MTRRQKAAVLAVVLATSVAALALQATLAYDPWAWLVWGRELARFDLDTTGGPSWKPLPVLVTTPLAVTGALAPTAFLVLSRAAGLLALVGAFQLGRRLRDPIAGALAAGLLVLTPDEGPRFVRLVLEGHSAPWTAALALWAVDRHLAGRPRQTLVLLLLLAWDRPEAWPFLLAYAGWRAVEDPRDRVPAVLALVSVPLLWFGGDWVGSGSPLHGASAAQVAVGESGRLGAAVEAAWRSVLGVVWVFSLVAAVRGWSHRDRVPAALVGLAVAWSVLVVGMGAGWGYAALSRFFLPAAALLCVAGAVGMVDVVRWPRGAAARAAVGVAVGTVVLVAAAPRVTSIDRQYVEVRERAEADRDLARVLDEAGGIDQLEQCGALSIDSSDVPRPTLAWRADRPFRSVLRPAKVDRGTVIATRGGKVDRLLAGSPEAEQLATAGRWVLYGVGCD